jgi:hypothetical protein
VLVAIAYLQDDGPLLGGRRGSHPIVIWLWMDGVDVGRRRLALDVVIVSRRGWRGPKIITGNRSYAQDREREDARR